MHVHGLTTSDCSKDSGEEGGAEDQQGQILGVESSSPFSWQDGLRKQTGLCVSKVSVLCGRPAEATQRGPLARPRGGFDVYAIVGFLKCVIYCDFFRHSKYTSTFYT